MMIFNVTHKYNPLEAFLFDWIVSQAVFYTISSFENTLLAAAEDGCRVLDVGCGGGQLAIDLKRTAKGLDVTGVDLSMSQVRRARRRSVKARTNVDFVQASALDLPFPDRSFDLVCSVDCLKHWPARGRGLEECIRVLRPGGMLLITEVNRECSLGDGWRFVRKWNVPAVIKPFSILPFYVFAVFRSLTMQEARALAEPLPLEDVTVELEPSGVNWTLKASKPRDIRHP